MPVTAAVLAAAIEARRAAATAKLAAGKKHCGGCCEPGELLPLDAFATDRSQFDGRSARCKKCRAAAQRARYEAMTPAARAADQEAHNRRARKRREAARLAAQFAAVRAQRAAELASARQRVADHAAAVAALRAIDSGPAKTPHLCKRCRQVKPPAAFDGRSPTCRECVTPAAARRYLYRGPISMAPPFMWCCGNQPDEGHDKSCALRARPATHPVG